MAKRRCVICGNEFEESAMIERFTGRMVYMCWECFKMGETKANERGIDLGRKIAKVKNK